MGVYRKKLLQVEADQWLPGKDFGACVDANGKIVLPAKEAKPTHQAVQRDSGGYFVRGTHPASGRPNAKVYIAPGDYLVWNGYQWEPMTKVLFEANFAAVSDDDLPVTHAELREALSHLQLAFEDSDDA